MKSSTFPSHWDLYPLTYTAYKITQPMQIDGDLTKEVWQKAPWSTPFADIQGKDAPKDAYSPARTQFKALYDDNFLYIGALLHPSPDFPTEAHFTERNSPIYQLDSDFEIFIGTAMSNHNYKEFEVNALNTVWNLMLNKPYMDGGVEHSARQHKPGDPEYYEVHQQRSATKVLEGSLNADTQGALWSVEVALAYSDLMAYSGLLAMTSPPSTGDLWRINFSRVELQGKVNWTWQPQVVWNGTSFHGQINMHLPDAWGYLSFDVDNHKDALWPARLTAMHIYYAQHCYKNEKGVFTSHLKELSPWLNDAIVTPFQEYIRIEIPQDSMHDKFTAFVTLDEATVIIQGDRKMQVLADPV